MRSGKLTQFPDIQSGTIVPEWQVACRLVRPGFIESGQIRCPEHGARDIALEHFLQG